MRTAVYSNLDNSADTGTTYTVNEVVSAGIDRLYTDMVDSLGRVLQRNHDYNADGVVDMVEYYEIDPDTGNTVGVYYNRDNDYKDGVALTEKTGQTLTLNDGRVISGVDNYTLRTFDDNNKIIGESFNLDASGAIDRQYYYVVDVYGNRLAEYQNLDNDTTLTLTGESQVTGQTITLADGREVQGIERFYLYERNANGQLIKTENNLDGKGQIESVVYYERDAYGREVMRYENANNDLWSDGSENLTGYSYTINGETVNGIDKVTKYERDVNGNILTQSVNNTGEADKFTDITTNTYNERNQKVTDSIVYQTDSGEVAGASNTYTYDIYGRNLTRSYETDSTHDGFERVETYIRDVYGNTVRTNNDVLGDSVDINSYTTIIRDHLGREIENISYANGVLSSRVVTEYNQYNQAIKRSVYNSLDGKPVSATIYTYNERGQTIREWSDRDASGVFDKNDAIFEYTRASDAAGTILARRDITPTSDTTSQWFYDYMGRRIMTLHDLDGDREIDAGEQNWRFTFYGNTNAMNTIRIYSGEDTLVSIQKLTYNGQSQQIARVRGGADDIYRTFDYDGYGAPRNYIDDLTTEWRDLYNDDLFAEIGNSISTINLSNATAKTDITIDSNAIAKLSSGVTPTTATGDTTQTIVLTINGDATDSVRLKDYSEFTKVEGTVKVGSNNYDKLTTEVEGKTYTLLVDTDINLYDADSGTIIS